MNGYYMDITQTHIDISCIYIRTELIGVSVATPGILVMLALLKNRIWATLIWTSKYINETTKEKFNLCLTKEMPIHEIWQLPLVSFDILKSLWNSLIVNAIKYVINQTIIIFHAVGLDLWCFERGMDQRVGLGIKSIVLVTLEWD